MFITAAICSFRNVHHGGNLDMTEFVLAPKQRSSPCSLVQGRRGTV
jgi:hypothetical protein